MSILDTFKSLVSGIFSNKKRGITGASQPPTLYGGLAVYPNANTQRFIDEGFCGNGSIYTIVATVARKFGSIPRYVYKIEDKKAARELKALIKQRNYKLKKLNDLQLKAYNETVVDNDFSELLAQPNENQGQDAFYELTCVFYMTAGEAFIRLNRGDIQDLTDEQADAMPPLELTSLPPQYVEIVPDPTDVYGVIGYYFVINGVRKFIRKADMIHWKRPNPQFDGQTRIHQRGLSPLQPGNKLMTQDESATDAAVAMQQNGGARGALYNETMDNLDPVQRTQIERVVDKKLNGVDRKGAVATMQGKWGYLDIGQSSVDMELVDSMDQVFVRLCNLFGVNPMLFLSQATYANVQQARKDLVTSLVMPMACSLRDEMNRVLLPAFGLDKSYTHDADISQLPELQEEMGQLISSLMQAWILTPNQRLEMMNEEKSADPLMDKVWVPNNLLLLDDAAVSDSLNSFTDGTGTNQTPGGKPGADLPKGGPGAGN
jgi:HK97 family phage portal protein